MPLIVFVLLILAVALVVGGQRDWAAFAGCLLVVALIYWLFFASP